MAHGSLAGHFYALTIPERYSIFLTLLFLHLCEQLSKNFTALFLSTQIMKIFCKSFLLQGWCK